MKWEMVSETMEVHSLSFIFVRKLLNYKMCLMASRELRSPTCPIPPKVKVDNVHACMYSQTLSSSRLNLGVWRQEPVDQTEVMYTTCRPVVRV